MIFSRHARQRWEERFPELTPLEEWEDALDRGTPKKLLNKLRRQCRIAKGSKYWVSGRGVVFVTDRDKFVITVFGLNTDQRY